MSTVRQLSASELRQLPPVIDVPTAAAVLGVGKGTVYEAIRVGEWPTPILHLGRQIRILTAPLLELVSLPG